MDQRRRRVLGQKTVIFILIRDVNGKDKIIVHLEDTTGECINIFVTDIGKVFFNKAKRAQTIHGIINKSYSCKCKNF